MLRDAVEKAVNSGSVSMAPTWAARNASGRAAKSRSITKPLRTAEPTRAMRPEHEAVSRGETPSRSGTPSRSSARCQQGWQEGAGVKVPVAPAVVERALCDAQHIGSIDGNAPERAHQDIPPSVARFVWRRDGGRCRVPGCRSARGLELHHIIHRADGGSHDAGDIVLACSSCHQSHHTGVLTISGTADQLDVRRPGDAHVGVGSQLDGEIVRTHAKVALTGLGWKPAIAVEAVAAAVDAVGANVALERLIVEALRRCPVPRG
jgi:HNH endonuclease